jgi:protoporphyrinogen/coproporphyrinogen III oxidase
MKSDISCAEVIVVGAGIAGLTAAHVLQQRGIPVKVIEAASRVGGRMTSDEANGHVIDRGAQFLSTEYAVILDLLRQLGLSKLIRPTSQYSAIVRDGIPRRMRIDRPMDALTSGLLRPTAWLKLGWKSLLLSGQLRKRSLSSYSQWSAYDSEYVSAWADSEIDPEVVEYVYEPMLQGFYFQTPEETSIAFGHALTAFGLRRAKTLTLEGGLGVLPNELARELDVELNTPVSRIGFLDGAMSIATPSGERRANRLILAVPAPIASRMLEALPDELTGRLLATPYTSSINVAVVTDANFRLPDNLKNVYGLLIPRRERHGVAAIGIENNKNRSHAATGYLLNIMLSHEFATRCMPSNDDAIVTQALQGAQAHLPFLSQHMTQAHVYRWPMAEPLSNIGRAKDLQLYREQCIKVPPSLVLAGDYMSMPYTEGAAESGMWAAELVACTASGKGMKTETVNPAARPNPAVQGTLRDEAAQRP